MTRQRLKMVNDMIEHLKFFLTGAGRVLDLAPASRFERFIPQQTDSERLRSDLYRIGADMQKVIGAQFADGRKFKPSDE